MTRAHRTETHHEDDEQTSGSVPAVQELRPLTTPPTRNAFESYGEQASQSSNLVGTLVKFNKGDWLKGENTELPLGAHFVANMDQLLVGWVKWDSNTPVEQIVGLVCEGYVIPKRSTLGDQDQSQWEVDGQGKARDPWQPTNYLVLKTPGKKAIDDNLFTFATSSKSGIGAVGLLCKEYGKKMSQHEDEYPVIELGVDSYVHKEYGRIKTPTLTIVGWEKKSKFQVEGHAEAEEEEAPAPRSRRR